MIDTSEFQVKIAKFISGEDISLNAANFIEVALDEGFPHDEYIQETVEMLATYRPEGGDFIHSVAAMQHRLVETMVRIQNAI